MLDVKYLRENPEAVIENLKRRPDCDTTIVETVLEADQNWRNLKTELDQLKSQKNAASKEIASIKKAGGDIQEQVNKVQSIADEIDQKEEALKSREEERDRLLAQIPNLLDEDVPYGEDDDENKTLRTEGKKPEFPFTPRSHIELCELNDWFDLDTAATHSGARFYYLKNELVQLQLALYWLVMNRMMEKGYTPLETPPMLRREALNCSVSLDDFEEVIYKIEDEDLYLIGTSEHALAVQHAGETLNYRDLPKKYVGLSPCFRKEAGVTKDSKGIFRVHNFNKIEQFVFCRQEDSDAMHEEITKNAEEVLGMLDLHYQLVDICSGDIGHFAARKYDLEAWLPSQDQFREMVSSSNYRDYSARRLNARYQDEHNEIRQMHTLNSTAVALTRIMVAILEQHQTEDGNVRLPEALRQLIGREFLKRS